MKTNLMICSKIIHHFGKHKAWKLAETIVPMNIDLCELQSKTKLFISHHHIRNALILFLLTGKRKMRRQRRRGKKFADVDRNEFIYKSQMKSFKNLFFFSWRRKWGSKKCLIRIFSAFVTSRPSWPGLVAGGKWESVIRKIFGISIKNHLYISIFFVSPGTSDH